MARWGWIVIKKWYNRWLRLQTTIFLGRIYIARGPWHFGDFRNMFLPNRGEDQKKVLPFESETPGNVPYGKSGPGYSITFIKKG